MVDVKDLSVLKTVDKKAKVYAAFSDGSLKPLGISTYVVDSSLVLFAKNSSKDYLTVSKLLDKIAYERGDSCWIDDYPEFDVTAGLFDDGSPFYECTLSVSDNGPENIDCLLDVEHMVIDMKVDGNKVLLLCTD